jgi:predicted phage replisome organizer
VEERLGEKMAEIKWIKLNTDMFDDTKIKLIENMPEGDSLLVVWIKLLALAGKTNRDGYIYLTEDIPYTDEMLSIVFNRPLQIVRLAIQTFQGMNMVEVDNGIIALVNWEKHQNIDGMDKVREQNRLRQQAHKEKKRLQRLGNVIGNVTVTQGNATDKEIDKELDIDKEIDNGTHAIIDSIYETLTLRLVTLLKFNNPKVRIPQDLEKWHNAIRLLIERDGHTQEEVLRMIEFSQTDDFWKSNILSATKLREKKDTLLMQSNRVKRMTPDSIMSTLNAMSDEFF